MPTTGSGYWQWRRRAVRCLWLPVIFLIRCVLRWGFPSPMKVRAFSVVAIRWVVILPTGNYVQPGLIGIPGPGVFITLSATTVSIPPFWALITWGRRTMCGFEGEQATFWCTVSLSCL